MKKKDITSKLTFEENPALEIRGEVLEVNADAPTMLKIMGLMNGSTLPTKHVKDAYELIFAKVTREKIDAMKLSVKDWMTVVKEAMSLILDEDTDQGEQ